MARTVPASPGLCLPAGHVCKKFGRVPVPAIRAACRQSNGSTPRRNPIPDSIT